MSWQPPSDQPSGWEPPPGQQPPPGPQPPASGNWPPIGPGPGSGPQWGSPPPKDNGKAIAALILGIAGIVVCPLICSVIALVLGYQARSEIDRSNGAIGGRGMAVAGIVLGWIGLAFGILLALFFGAAIVTGLENGDFETESSSDSDYF